MNYWASWKRRREKKYQIIYKRGPSILALVFAGMALSLWGIFLLLSSYPVFLYIYYTAVPETSRLLSSALAKTSSESTNIVAAAEEQQIPMPSSQPTEVPKDPNLPSGHILNIPSVGIDTEIREASSSAYEDALRHGVWRVPEFASPDPDTAKAGRPIILAAHRFGYTSWTQSYREQNSFYLLPNVKVGESVKIIWDQRLYTYKVTKIEEGTEITDYSSDLILYTCKFLVSPIRIIVYAELVK